MSTANIRAATSFPPFQFQFQFEEPQTREKKLKENDYTNGVRAVSHRRHSPMPSSPSHSGLNHSRELRDGARLLVQVADLAGARVDLRVGFGEHDWGVGVHCE